MNELRLVDLYNVADCFLMFSSQEAFGKTAIESLACGTPILIVKGTGPAEIQKLVMNRNYCIDEDSIEDVVNLEPEVGRVEAHFSIQAIAAQYLSLYKEIL